MTPNDEKELSRFDYRKDVSEEQASLMICVRDSFKELAAAILRAVPSSADRSSAMRYLRLAQMQVNAAICHDWVDEEKKDDK